MTDYDLVVVGQGYVGLPMALRAAEAGLRVVGLDTNAGLVAALAAGRSHVSDVSDKQLREGLSNGYLPSCDTSLLGRARAIVVCVPTPLSEAGGPDLSAVTAAARMVGDWVSPGALVVLESTTYPGTTEELFAPLVLRGGHRVGVDLNIAFSPERIDPGNRTYQVRNTPKVVGGLTDECTRRASQFYSSFIDRVICARGAREAEMAKLLENTFRHVNIALVNEMVRFCEELDIDLWNAIECAETKPFGFMAFRPGPGVGGHCIPVDPAYLSHRVKARLGYAFRMVELAEEINKAAPLYVADRVWEALNDQSLPVRGAKVLLAGVTYKPDVADCRETPASPLAQRLLSWGADVVFHDPLVEQWCVGGRESSTVLRSEPDLYEAAASAYLTVLLQPHSDYDLCRLSDSAPLVLDTRAVMKPAGHIIRL